MINKLLICLFGFFILPNVALSQLDTSAFKAKIIDYTITDSVHKTESMITITYASTDSTNIYEVNYNLEREIIDDKWWGVAIANRVLDKLGRVIETSSYKADGTFAILETPPIIETVYLDSISIEQTNYRNGDRSIEGRIESTYDSERREIERRSYDKNLELHSITTYDFDDENHTRTKKRYDAELELQTSKCGCAIHVITFEDGIFEEYNFYTWIEERFYDEHMNLIDCSHNYTHDQQFSIVQREKLGDNRMRFVLRNAQNEIVSSEEFTMDKD